jgi:hypothetical protein
MKVKSTTYVPVLKWRTGEYQALFRLADEAKDSIIPLMIIPEIEFDFEEWAPKKTVPEHITPFGKRYKGKWNTRPAWLDLDPSLHGEKMDSGLSVVTHVFSELRQFNAKAVPVLSIEQKSGHVAEIAAIVKKDKLGAAVRARLAHVRTPDFNTKLSQLLADAGVTPEQTDFFVDLNSPAYEPYDVFGKALIIALGKITSLPAFRSFVIIGTAFPESMKDVSPPGANLLRHDWMFFKKLVSLLPARMRKPAYGDYTTVNPAFAAAIDMRKISPAGKLVYTAKDKWRILKGKAFRADRKQMHEHCDKLIKSPEYRGATYSVGDDFIQKCAIKKAGPSTLTKWKEVGINHHIMHVLEDISSFGGKP